jgi:hypothetical protein
VYTPFNVLARGGNYAFSKAASSSFITNRAAAGSGSFASGMANLNSEGKAFSAGALSRVTAADKMARGKLPSGNIMNFLGETDKELVKSFETVKSARYKAQQAFLNKSGLPNSVPLSAVQATGDDATRLAYASVNGSISGRVSGFMSQVRMGNAGMDAVKAAEGAGNKAFASGTQAAEKFMAKGGFTRAGGQFTVRGGSAAGNALLTKGGLKAGEKVTLNAAMKVGGKQGLKIGARLAAAGAVNAVPIAGQIVSAVLLADLAMDVGKLGVEVFKSGVDFAKDAAISYKGSINKGVMGMGYRDNTVAATSRSRGVQAIQNSRLNARSVLGSEAGAMHAHFG